METCDQINNSVSHVKLGAPNLTFELKNSRESEKKVAFHVCDSPREKKKIQSCNLGEMGGGRETKLDGNEIR